MIREAHAQAIKDKENAKRHTRIKKLQAENFGALHSNIPPTKRDVEDEAQHLDALDHVEVVDVDADENLVDMDTLSPQMREQFTEGEYVNQWVG